MTSTQQQSSRDAFNRDTPSYFEQGSKDDSTAESSKTNSSVNSDDEARTSLASSASSSKARKRIDLSSLRTSTMFESRNADNHNRNRALPDWTVPPSRNGRAPRAATLFLGKDHERWQRYERENMGGGTLGAGLHLAWKRGTASLVNRLSTVEIGADYDNDDEDGEDEDDESDIEDEDAWLSSSSVGALSRRSSQRRRSSGRTSRSQSGSYTGKLMQTSFSGDTSVSSSTTASESGNNGGGGQRLRRFSSNGPEAAFLRHETVIGIHTPRRESLSERLQLAPLSQIKQPVSGSPSQMSPTSTTFGLKKKVNRKMRKSSKSEVLEQQAAAAATAHQRFNRNIKSNLVSSAPSSSSGDEEASQASSLPGIPLSKRKPHRSASPRLALKLAKRRKPIKVDGTLYDRSGPFREGAVTDGLSVRLFSAEDINEASDLKASSLAKPDQAVDDEDLIPTTYLITTPDNRVSSAAKLRRWAMDGEGNFYAAMEIKSIEAKMRAADPAMNGANGQMSKGLLRTLRDRYLEDLLDEVQKAETLNPGRDAVSKVLKTSDGKYIRLEEDYPEESFFVIAGCDETELYPAIALVFCQAIKAIVRFHSAGWLHGDIKLENLMFDMKGNMVVIDYENANPYRGVAGGDGRVTLASYDWIPPEAFPGANGRRVGPSADLWALGCNMVRAFALRDQIEDTDIRETLLGKGQNAFLAYRKFQLLRRDPSRRGSDVGIPGSITRPLPTSKDIDLSSLFNDDDEQAFISSALHDRHHNGRLDSYGSKKVHQGDATRVNQMPPPPGPSAKRLLSRFAREAPDLLKLVLARCITELPEERSIEAEVECLQFVERLEAEQREKGDASILSIGSRAVKTAIELSGSAWVKPKLDEARKSLNLGP